MKLYPPAFCYINYLFFNLLTSPSAEPRQRPLVRSSMADATSTRERGPSGGNGSGKRRLSPRFNGDSPDKRPRGSLAAATVDDSEDQEQSATRTRDEPNSGTGDGWKANQRSFNESSTRFDQARSTRSPSTHSSDSEHIPAAPQSRSTSRGGRTNSSTHSTHSQHPALKAEAPMLPKWRTSSVENDRDMSVYNASSSRGSTGNAYPPRSSTSSRMHSPPPSFNLSTGQPLVNPPLKTQAAFVGKLYAMLEDEEIKKTGLIYWSADGSIFTCPNPTEFSKYDSKPVLSA